MNRSRITLVVASIVILTIATLGLLNRRKLEETFRPQPTFDPRIDYARRAVDQELVAANTDFGLRLFLKGSEQSPNKSFLLAPASVAYLLALLTNGAKGDTQAALFETLGLSNWETDKLNESNDWLGLTIRYPHPKVVSRLATSIWVKDGYEIKQGFRDIALNDYAAEIQNLDFNSWAATGTINNWVDRETDGKIQDLIDEIDPQSLMIIINALYFESHWTEEFDKSLTADKDFILSDSQKVKVPMMTVELQTMYLEGADFQAVSLPYGGDDGYGTGSGNDVSLYVFLPTEPSNLASFYSELTASNWANWFTRFELAYGHVELPRFKVESEIDLIPLLSQMGLDIIFDAQQADFENVMQPNGYVGKFDQRTIIEVDEEGTSAAAVSNVGIFKIGTSSSRGPFSFVADHPFFFAIRDDVTGTILFMGTYTGIN